MASIFPDQYLSNLDRQIWLETVSVGNGVATLQKLAVFLAGDRIIVATTRANLPRTVRGRMLSCFHSDGIWKMPRCLAAYLPAANPMEIVIISCSILWITCFLEFAAEPLPAGRDRPEDGRSGAGSCVRVDRAPLLFDVDAIARPGAGRHDRFVLHARRLAQAPTLPDRMQRLPVDRAPFPRSARLTHLPTATFLCASSRAAACGRRRCRVRPRPFPDQSNRASAV